MTSVGSAPAGSAETAVHAADVVVVYAAERKAEAERRG